MTFTLADKTDIPQLTQLRIEFLKEDFDGMTEETIKTLEANITAFFEKHLNNDAFVFIARNDDKIVSTAILNIIEKPANPNYIHGRVGEVNSVYTLPEYRRHGYALQIIKNLMEYSKENQIDRVDLKATRMGTPVYSKAGFEITENTHTLMHFSNK